MVAEPKGVVSVNASHVPRPLSTLTPKSSLVLLTAEHSLAPTASLHLSTTLMGSPLRPPEPSKPAHAYPAPGPSLKA